MTAGGGESIKQCADHNNDWCCNGDDTHVKCCQESPSPRPFFALQDGQAYATIGSNQAQSVPTLSGITGLVSGTASGNTPSETAGSSNAPTASASNSQAGSATVDSVSTTAKPFTSVSASVSSGSAGVATIYITAVVTPTASSTTGGASGGSSSSSGGGSSNLGVIIGCAVGIPLALALVGILFWLLRKRRNQKANPYKGTSELDGDSPGGAPLVGGAAGKLGKKEQYRHSRPGTAEIDGNPVGAGRPISNIKGHAELDSGSGFQPGQGTPYAPDTVGLGGGSGAARDTWGSVPPQYSPAHNQTGFNHADASELDSTAVMPVINEKTDGPQQYVAYKPPHPVAELPTIKTPPEDLEKQLQR